MLAWIHQAAAVERELVHALFGKKDTEISSEVNFETSSTSDARLRSEDDVLAAILQSLGPPLVARILTVIEDNKDLVTGFKLVNHLSFFQTTIVHLIPRDSPLGRAVEDCHEKTIHKFSSLLSSYEVHIRNISESTKDLSPPPFLYESCKVLSGILEVYETSFSADNEQIGRDVDENVGRLLITLLESCQASVESLSIADGAVFMLNSLSAIILSVGAHRTSEKWIIELEDQETKKWLDELMKNLAGRVLDKCGLSTVLRAIESKVDGTATVDLTCLEADMLAETCASFYSIFFSFVMPELERLLNPALKVRRTVDQIHDG
jgi:hypothetical protein